MSGLLNPPLEAAVCRKMLDRVSQELRANEGALVSNVMERERYLVFMGRIEALRTIQKQLQDIYAREFDK